ncbi:MAG TPA: Holliday junction resolvase RuvX, partial [Dehalococcoidia bacterium]|nr:Holliday junction resolvase RuvX [Dehalococcoidia bacterium]
SFALPLRSVERDARGGRDFEELRALARDEEVAEIVVGLPLSMSGEDSAQTQRARDFAAELERRLGLPVHLWDERLSTQEALRLTSNEGRSAGGRRGRGRATPPAADTDALAASIILQAYLDARRIERS